MGWLWGGFWNNAMPHGVDATANNEAQAWQIVLQLRALFEAQPELIDALIESDPAEHERYSVDLVMSAALEAVAARPDDVRIRYHAAAAALKLGRSADAQALLARPEKKAVGGESAAKPGANGSEAVVAPTAHQRPAPPGRAQSPVDSRVPLWAPPADGHSRPPG